MNKQNIYIGNQKLINNQEKVQGKFVTLNGERFYKIDHYNNMPPFLMNIVSYSDHWMFISSSGGVTAGRKNADHALFPYYTDDKIHESADKAGSKVILKVKQDDHYLLWEPFSDILGGMYSIRRNLYKNIAGNTVIFEEVNIDLKLSCQVQWMNCDTYGWVKKTSLFNHGDSPRSISMLDALVNILPYGILKTVQEQFSTLMDAYKKSELDEESGLGIFSMSSIPVDRAEPSESLRATTAWHTAKNVSQILLSTNQFEAFRTGIIVNTEREKRGVRGAYAIIKEVNLKPGASDSHMIVAETDQDSTAIHNLSKEIVNTGINIERIEKEVKSDTTKLENLISEADGIQAGGDEFNTARHFSNVLFNVMRGGIYDNIYNINTEKLASHILVVNKKVFEENKDWLKSLPVDIKYQDLISRIPESKPDLQRIVTEYLPLTFSRRHGDPSRPWNRFSIDVRNPDGSRKISYEGNWRDIFQNWEALSWSYPGFLEGIISKFLNASTIDGYNPYRITDKGIDWETFNPDDPWSFIGYWGDHQIIYLLKLLELQEKYSPGKFQQSLQKEYFTFACVPYKIRPYEDIIRNPNDTIIFDEKLHKYLLTKEAEIGTDGKLLADAHGNLKHVNLLDKLLITILTKLGNLIPGAGIWLNTQRPEWNDANNALVGNGVSMVTLYYLRRFINFLNNQIQTSNIEEFSITEGTFNFFTSIEDIFSASNEYLAQGFDDQTRKSFMDSLGKAGSSYREIVYKNPSSETKILPKSDLEDFFILALKYIDQSIRENKRSDELYHAYNLIEIGSSEVCIKRLPLMLEGQVAFMSAGYANLDEITSLLDAMKKSKLFREDQQSYMLYPNKELPLFLKKNTIAPKEVKNYPVIEKILDAGGLNILSRDYAGNVHFDGDFRNIGVLKQRIESIKNENNTLISNEEKEQLLTLYESLFRHNEFTGRSGSFFKYEGLGSIYWHMVSKLLLAVAENIAWFSNEDIASNGHTKSLSPNEQESLKQLQNAYLEIRKGLGVHKNPADYGAFPIDPYSHTPSMMGAQQPGMTGQVKEDIIARWFELGLSVSQGSIELNPNRVNKSELNAKGELSFSFCGILFTYTGGIENIVIIVNLNGEEITFPDSKIDPTYSKMIFDRSGEIREVKVIYRKG